LTRAELLVAVKGARGGYTLARRPSDIDLYDVIGVAGGATSLDICISGKNRCPEIASCALYPIWEKASNSVVSIFKNARLSSLRKPQ
jgi:Rrf2 family protein